MHYERKRKGKEIGDASPQRNAAGEGYTREDGYRVIYVKNKMILEHRHKIEQLLGRRLLRHETVHHVNGQRSDNRTAGPLVNFRSGNLELWSSWQPAGQRVIDKIEFAIELLQKYAPERLSD